MVDSPLMGTTKASSSSTSSGTPLLNKPKGVRKFPTKAFENFRSNGDHSVQTTVFVGNNGRAYNNKGAAENIANAPLFRRLKGRHLQMIAIGGSIGTGLFVGSGAALAAGGPGSLLIAFIIMGAVLFFTVQALGEMAVAFPVAGSFSTFSSRFIDPAWGFATGWNYALEWLMVMPLEIISASITLDYWELLIPKWVSITVFLTAVISINLCGIKIYGEAEYGFSILKVSAIIGFIILGSVINCAGTPDSGYIGGRYWVHPGAFVDGFKGFCDILVTSAFSFAGTELVGLASAETYNPSKSLPSAIKQVFWRIVLFYVTSIGIIGLLVPYNNPQLISRSNIGNKASPFIIAIKGAGINGLDSVMNAVILVAVLSVASSSMFGSSRTLAALAAQGQAPQVLGYIDRKGRPLGAIGVAAVIGLLSFLYITPIQGEAFTWLLALSGLSTIFTWCSICFAHIRFRAAWIRQGNSLDSLIYRSPVGSVGSWIGLVSLILVLIAQFWVALAPVGGSAHTEKARVANFMGAYLAMPVVILFYLFYKFYCQTKFLSIDEIDLRTGRNEFEVRFLGQGERLDRSSWPKWKVWYNTLC